MLTQLKPYQQQIHDQLQQTLADHKADDPVWSQLEGFLLAGKTLRGAMMLALAEALGATNRDQLVTVATSLEFFNAALLIHDDIQDQDRQRRGQPSLYVQYESIAKGQHFADPTHWGEAMAINAGDLCLFMSQKMLAESLIPDQIKTHLFTVLATEALQTGYGQMQDLVSAAQPVERVSEADVYRIHRLKTARYTFCLPFGWAAIAAGVAETTRTQLVQIAEQLGGLFQMKDDELGLFGNPNQTGKSNLSDIQAAKKTIFYLQIMQQAQPADQLKLKEIFGSTQVSPDQAAWVRQLIEDVGIRSSIQAQMTETTQQTTQLIQALDTTTQTKDLLTEILSYVTTRTK